MLVRSSNSDKLSNRVVHVSVQLFSNEDLALAMTESMSLLNIMVSSLKNMMTSVLVGSDISENASEHKVRGLLSEVVKSFFSCISVSMIQIQIVLSSFIC